MPKPLAIIPAFVRNMMDCEMLSRTLTTLRDTAGGDCDVMVVDDGSPETDLVAYCRGITEAVGGEFVAKERNEGFASTVNVGLRRSYTEKRDSILVNADIEFTDPHWLTLMLRQRTSDGEKPASVVGALLLYPNGLIQHCSPPGEKVRTVGDGDVTIEHLDPDVHGLVSYSRRFDTLYRPRDKRGQGDGVNKHPNGGFRFDISRAPYAGEIVTLRAGKSETRVTPNHLVTAFWQPRAFASYVVYLMRRGSRWRIGTTAFTQSIATGATIFGPGLRLRKQDGDELWVIAYCDTADEAWKLEKLLSWEYQVPQWEFVISGRAPRKVQILQARQDDLWESVDCTGTARALLSDYELAETCPLLSRNGTRAAPILLQGRGYTLAAANLRPGIHKIPVDTGDPVPAREQLTTTRDYYEGDVYGIDIEPHQHYVSEGIVVHNSGIYFSLLYREFDHVYRYGPANLPEAHHARVCPVTGALQFIRHECLEEVGLYDDSFKMGWEDVDYCVRVWLSGRECIYQPKVTAIHHEGYFRGNHRTSTKVAKWQHESWLRFCAKWGTVSFAEFVPSLTLGEDE